MKKTISKILSLTVLGLMSFTSLCFINPSVKASASTNILLGDANNDGYVNMSDCVYIIQYLYGAQSPNAISVTAMDLNEDYVIDMTDAYIIQYMEAYSISPTIKNKNLYSIPVNTTRKYYKHQCSSNDFTSVSEYTLSNGSVPLNIDDLPALRGVSSSPEQVDSINQNVVQLTIGNNDSFHGSGFIIDNHVIATAAHCVYDRETDEFKPNIKIKIYSGSTANSSNLLLTASATYIHIPKEYVTSNGHEDNYDYALIYVDEDLLQQNITGLSLWQTGVAITEIMNSNAVATTSGYRNLSGTIGRYYSTGNVLNISSPDPNGNYPSMRLRTSGNSYPGKSGGVVYYESNYNSFSNKSAIAVVTGAEDGYSGGNTWATRFNPTLLRFYFQNPNI